jgi:hypothetical protein
MANGLQHLRGEFVVDPGCEFRLRPNVRERDAAFCKTNQALGLRSAKIIRSRERKSVRDWFLKELMWTVQ